MTFQAQTLCLEDIPNLLDLERKKLSSLEEFEAKMLEWDARWREEQLRHYIPQGWSFALYSEEGPIAYFLAKVLPFFRSQTQVLWVEHVFASGEKEQEDLLELMYRFAREKHLQQILIENYQWSEALQARYKMQKDGAQWTKVSMGK